MTQYNLIIQAQSIPEKPLKIDTFRTGTKISWCTVIGRFDWDSKLLPTKLVERSFINKVDAEMLIHEFLE